MRDDFFKFINELQDAHLHEAPKWARNLFKLYEEGGREAVIEAIHRGLMRSKRSPEAIPPGAATMWAYRHLGLGHKKVGQNMKNGVITLECEGCGARAIVDKTLPSVN